MKILPPSFYRRDPLTVAPDLLGKYLVRRLKNGVTVSGILSEVEAYLGEDDPAAHSFRGKTPRNQSTYKNGGHAYIHTMRHHVLMDVVTGNSNEPGSILLRAVFPKEGIEEMQRVRSRDTVLDLANGPGKLCQAFQISKDFDGEDLTTSTRIWLEDRKLVIKPSEIFRTPRIGIGKGTDSLYRFIINDTSSL